MVKLSLLLLAACAIVGCNGSSTAGNASPATGEGKRLKIVYIPKNTGNPYFNEVNRGFESACKELNADFSTLGPATADATSQLTIIKDQIQRGVDVIALSANSVDALNPVLDQARQRGVVVVTVDADLVGNEEHRDAAVTPADFSKVGKEQLELIGKLTGYEGSIAILSATTDAPNQNVWIADMKKALQDPKYAKMKLVDTVFGDDEPQKSTTECEGLLAKHPDLAGIVSPTSVGLAASAQVLQQAGVYPGGPKAKGKGIQLTGLSTPKQLAPFVQKGVVTAFQLWSPYNEGYLAAYIGAQIKQGKLKPAEGAKFTTPQLKESEFHGKNEVVAGPLITFDKTNVTKFAF